MIGVIVPAKNEAETLPVCLSALGRAARHDALAGEGVVLCVVLNDCGDASEAIVRAHGLTPLRLREANVGAARRAGAQHLLGLGARFLCCTDADSEVADDWIVAHLAEEADVVCGTVSVGDWRDHPAETMRRYLDGYVAHRGHRHVHGANLGFTREAYERAGGFLPLRAHEDVALVRAFERTGARIAWTDAPRVVTSARREGRASDGFAAFLRNLGRHVPAG